MAKEKGTIIDLPWIPAHMDIGDNEACDQAAKHALSLDFESPIPLGPSELFNLIRSHI